MDTGGAQVAFRMRRREDVLVMLKWKHSLDHMRVGRAAWFNPTEERVERTCAGRRGPCVRAMPLDSRGN